jgi:hypothetical protein
VLVSACLFILVLPSCGGGGAAEDSSPTTDARSTVVGPIRDPSNPPNVPLPPGPPPANLVVRDIKKGSGVPVPAKGEVKITGVAS